MKPISGSSIPVFDPLQYGVDLPYETTLYPLGFRLQLITNSREIIEAGKEDWAGFPLLYYDRTLEIRVAVSDDEQTPCPTSLIWRAQGHLLALESDRQNFAACDLERGFSFCWLAPATARNHDFFRSYFLNTLIQTSLWQTHLTRIHAACVARDGRGLLLCGPSGAGKSCLAYACARRGWTFITDEVSSLVRGAKGPTVLGNPHCIHFRDTAAVILPEFDGRLAVRNSVGKISIEVRTSELHNMRTAFQCRVATVVFLERREDMPARLAPLSTAAAFHGLDTDLPLCPQPLYDAHRSALRNLVAAGAFELRYHDLDEAVSLLEPLLRVQEV